ncbi:hypothetical protein FIU83_15960 [Halomonas sp. THAF5a]|nr:hypothetical protein FIU83_15960 [Halomonas sp. THAF5a]
MARQDGITLIESLIALLLISVALLGVAGLQLLTLQDARDARWRSDAVSLANSAADLIRTRPENADQFKVEGADETIEACDGGDAAICERMETWLDDITQALPNSLAAIDVQQSDGVERVTITLRWRQQPPEADDPLPACGSEAPSGGCVMLETRL